MTFQPGKSGNPEGKRKVAETALSFQTQARKWAPEALSRIRKLAKSKNESIALRAACAMAEIAWPRQSAVEEPPELPDGVDPTEDIQVTYSVKPSTAPPLPDAPEPKHAES